VRAEIEPVARGGRRDHVCAGTGQPGTQLADQVVQLRARRRRGRAPQRVDQAVGSDLTPCFEQQQDEHEPLSSAAERHQPPVRLGFDTAQYPKIHSTIPQRRSGAFATPQLLIDGGIAGKHIGRPRSRCPPQL
jgi:hypothetical protein